MNAVVVNSTEQPFAILPTQINIDPNRYYKTTRDICYWNSEIVHDEYLINQFVEKAKEFNYTEEQALAVLTFNNYDYEKSECDLHIYRPIKGLDKVDAKQVVKVISDGISKTVKTREHRDFDDILLMFPGFTIGDVLGAYSKHRFLIKKQTYRVKKSIKKSICKPLVTNGNLKDNESSWNESCLDTQFQLVYNKHFQLISNYSSIQEIISRDLSTMKQSNKNGIKLGELNSYVEADGMLNLLRKMNRKKNKLGSALDKTQLLAILNSFYSEKIPKPYDDQLIKEDMNYINPSPCLSTSSNSPNADINSISSKEQMDDNHFEDKFHDYIKGSIRRSLLTEDLDCDDVKISDSLNTLLEQHESVLNGFKNFLPNPNEFQQLSHSWDNMDFAILLLALSEHGQNFSEISDAVFTKSESMIRSFYLNNKTELNLTEIIPKSFYEREPEPLQKDESEELIPTKHIKTEDTLENDPTPSNCSSDNNKMKKSSKKNNSKKTKATCKKSKKQSSSSSLNNNNNNNNNCKREEIDDNICVTRSLRSRPETKEIMKTLIDEEKKSYKRKSKKTNKRKSKHSDEDQPQSKRNRNI